MNVASLRNGGSWRRAALSIWARGNWDHSAHLMLIAERWEIPVSELCRGFRKHLGSLRTLHTGEIRMSRSMLT